MNRRTLLFIACCFFGTAGLTGVVRGQSTQSATRDDNPNYPKRNPFYFEGKINYELLGIDTPRDAWEFVQRGIYRQDDQEDFAGAIADYRRSIELNNLRNGTCQLVTSASVPANLTPAPCMFTVRLRLGYLLLHDHPEEAIGLFEEVLEIDPQRLEVHALIGEAHAELARETSNGAQKELHYRLAIEAFKKELALSPVTALSIKLTGDEANNAQVHWALAEIYEEIGSKAEAVSELHEYLKASKWHSDTYPWRITLAEKQIEELQHEN